MWIHILSAVVSLGAGPALGIMMLLYGSDEEHGTFVLKTVRRLFHILVFPGYLLMAPTGYLMAPEAGGFGAGWIAGSIILYLIGWVLLIGYQRLLGQEILARESEGDTQWHGGLKLASRALWVSAGVVVVAIVFLMVVKPTFVL